MEKLEVWKQIQEIFPDADDLQRQKLDVYAGLLIEWNRNMNLTAITEPQEIWEKHFYDSLLPLREVRLNGKAADVGTGAGFPGLVWKIMVPDVHMTLIEPTGKRCRFLEEVIRTLELKQVCVENCRAEEYAAEHRESFDFVTARAVANLRVLSELCLPLVRKDGLFIAMKGSKGRQEAEEAEHACKELGAVLENIQDIVLPGADARVNLFYRKTKLSPGKYPRNYGQIKKKPL